MSEGRVTVLFDDPFWIGLIEKIDGEGLRACKVTFGAEPTDGEVLAFISQQWSHLQFSPAVEADVVTPQRVNPKRQLREARKQVQSQGIGTKSQQALKMLQEQNKTERKQRTKAEREAAEQRKFDLRQAKKKEKHKGH